MSDVKQENYFLVDLVSVTQAVLSILFGIIFGKVK